MFLPARKILCVCIVAYPNVVRAEEPDSQSKGFEESKLRFSVTNVNFTNKPRLGFEISGLGNKTIDLGGKQIKEDSVLRFKFNPNKLNYDGCDACSEEKASIFFTIGNPSIQTINDVNAVVSLMTARETKLFSYHSNGFSYSYEAIESKFLGGVSIGSKDIRLNAQVGLGGGIEFGQTVGPIELSGVGSLSLDIGHFAKATARKEYNMSPSSGDWQDVESINIDTVPGKYIGNDKRNFHFGFEFRNEKFILNDGTDKFNSTYGGLKTSFQFSEALLNFRK